MQIAAILLQQCRLLVNALVKSSFFMILNTPKQVTLENKVLHFSNTNQKVKVTFNDSSSFSTYQNDGLIKYVHKEISLCNGPLDLSVVQRTWICLSPPESYCILSYPGNNQRKIIHSSSFCPCPHSFPCLFKKLFKWFNTHRLSNIQEIKCRGGILN